MAVWSGPSLASGRLQGWTRSSWTPSLPLLLGSVLFLALAGAQGLLADPDSHWHIAVGNWIFRYHAVPAVDPYSFTFAGQPWIAKEWLSQLILAAAYDLGGWGGVTVLGAAALALAFALLLRLLLQDLQPLPGLLLTGAAIAMTAPHFLVRPYVLAFPFMLWWVAGLIKAVEQRRAPAPLLLVAMLFWANLHGGFTLGLVIAAALALEAVVGARNIEERRVVIAAWTKFGIASVLVACLTPYGPESMLVTWRIFELGDALGSIAEWRSPDFLRQPLQELVLLIAVYAALSRGLKLPLMRLLILLGLLHLYLSHARNAELLAMLGPLLLAPMAARQWPKLQASDPSGNRFAMLAGPAGQSALAATLLLLGTIGAGVVRLGDVTPPPSTTPSAALEFVREAGIGGRVFNDYGYGGYLISVGIPTFIDGRAELFGGDFLKQYVAAVTLQKPLDALLDRYDIAWTLLPREAPANQLLAHLPGWRLAYADEQAMIFVRGR